MAKVITIRERALQSRDAVELVSHKWRIAVLHVLTPGPLRTRDLQQALEEVSAKMLTQTLRGMERDGLIERKIHSVVPARVEYELTEMGQSLIHPLGDLCRWAKAHLAERDTARKKYDSRQAVLPRTARRGSELS